MSTVRNFSNFLEKLYIGDKNIIIHAKTYTFYIKSQGGTFTISNLGMFGIKNFSAIINPPQVRYNQVNY